MFNSEKHMVYFALMGWVTYIETGNFSGMDKSTILELAKTDRDVRKVANKLPVLTREQQETVYKIQNLATKILNGGNIES